MEVKLKMETKRLKRLLDAASALSQEPTVRFGNEGVEFRQMDATAIGIICAKIPKSEFLEYAVVEQPMVAGLVEKDPNLICFNAAKLVKVIEKFGETTEVEVSEGGNRLNVASAVSGVKKRYSTPLLTVSGTGLGKIPKVEPSVMMVMNTSDFKRALKELNDTTESPHVEMSVENGVLTITAEGDNNTADLKFDKESPTMKSIEGGAEQTVASTFHMNVLLSIFGAVASPTIMLQLSTDKPLIIKDAEWDILAFLAPIVEKN